MKIAKKNPLVELSLFFVSIAACGFLNTLVSIKHEPLIGLGILVIAIDALAYWYSFKTLWRHPIITFMFFLANLSGVFLAAYLLTFMPMLAIYSFAVFIYSTWHLSKIFVGGPRAAVMKLFFYWALVAVVISLLMVVEIMLLGYQGAVF